MDLDVVRLAARLGAFLRPLVPNADVVDLRLLSHRWQVRTCRFSLYGQGPVRPCVLRLYDGPDAARRCRHETELAVNLCTQGFPVPEVLAHCLDPQVLGDPFQVVAHVGGSTLAEELARSRGAARQRCIERFMGLLVRLHRLPLQQVMPAEMLAEHEPTARLHETLMVQARAALLHTHRLTEFEPILAWIDSAFRGVRWSPAVLTHNDFHPGNILCGPDGVDRLIDWATVGASDARYDLGWTLMLASSYQGQSAYDTVLEAYRQAGGHPIESIDVFVLVAAVRRLMLRGLAAHAAARSIGMPRLRLINDPQEAQHLRSVCALIARISGSRLAGIERVLDG
jgi:aminoglycoside phosphotransferase (APT) family kinase protein